MTARDVRAEVVALIAALAPHPLPESELGPDANLVDDAGYDSLALLELAAAIEREFALPPLSEADVLDVQTVGQVTELVARHVMPQDPA